MTEISLCRYLAACISVPLVIPQMVLLLPHWRYSGKVMGLLAIGMEAAIALSAWVFWYFEGPTVLTAWIMGIAPPVICVVLFILCYGVRDGRLLFILDTLGLDVSLCDALCSIFATRNDPMWLFMKVGVTLLQAVLIQRFCKKPLLEMLDSNQIRWGQTALIPLCLWATALGYYAAMVLPGARNNAPVPTIIFCCGVVVIYIALYHFQQATLEQAEARQYNAVLESEIHALSRQAEQAGNAVENARALRHDIRHYTRLLRGCLNTGDTDSAREVLDLLDGNLEALPAFTSLERFTGNHIMDTMLTQCAEDCRRKGLSFQVELALPEDLRVDVTELAVVVSNALENAVSAAAQEPGMGGRVVSIRGGRKCGQFFLIVSNTFSGAVKPDPKTGLPHTDREGHGYGTYSIASFARKNHCFFDYKIQDGTFYLRILI